ncbi:sulfotransferase [Chitinophagaceae bacterium LB-8]|uniref:Sulfotransferase n=1 Tax=Paraflavisolibacter caeni TaxID=2982496 RepID=A0A9X3BGZ4_9BACT|nr:sulfotransferase [Paraflavisolibacter caeni]MCU7548677.1 sulfotransferase [Paraflavisolibacter caeni]
MNSNILMIIGMHRSGTSLITQWVHRCGLHVGDRLLIENVGNEDGHFEDEDFLELHTKFLLKRKVCSDGFIDTSPSQLTKVELQRMKALVYAKSKGNLQWGWKEPRTCLFLSEYRALIPDAFCLIVTRGYNDTVNSLVVREHRSHEERFQTKRGLSRLKWKLYKRKSLEYFFETRAELYLKTWIHYNEQILNHVSTLPAGRYLFVQYEDLFQNDEAYFDHLIKEWNFSLKYIPFRSVFKRSLLSDTRNIEGYIRDQQLLDKAKQVEYLCRSFCDFFQVRIPEIKVLQK